MTKVEEQELVELRNQLMKVGMKEFAKKSWLRYVTLLQKRRAARSN